MLIQFRSRACASASAPAIATAPTMSAISSSVTSACTQRGASCSGALAPSPRPCAADAGEIEITCGREVGGIAPHYRPENRKPETDAEICREKTRCISGSGDLVVNAAVNPNG